MIEGGNAVNIIQQKTAVAPVVEVRDRNDQQVSGVAGGAVAATNVVGAKDNGVGSGGSTSYTGPFSGQMAMTTTTSSANGSTTCVSNRALTGTLTIVMGGNGLTAGSSGTAQTTGTQTETSFTQSQFCSPEASASVPISWSLPVTTADVSLSLEGGDFVALVGPAGCGKSTLPHLCGAMDRPTSGVVSLDGTNLGTPEDDALTRVRRERVGFVFQFFNLLPTLRVVENVELPVLLVADEPTGNLDSDNGCAVLDLLVELNRDLGVTLLLATHAPDVAAAAGRVVCGRGGGRPNAGRWAPPRRTPPSRSR